MTGEIDEPTTSALVAASTELLEGLNSAESPLSIVSRSLASLAATLGVRQVMVAIDDVEYGRQVFCSGRTPLGDGGDLLCGPARVHTDPPRAIDDALGRLIVAAVTTTFERARTGQQPLARPDDLIMGLGAATQRSARYGWGFTLVLVRMDDADVRNRTRVEAHLRAGDSLLELGPRDLAILMPAAPGDEVPTILARVGRSGTVSTFCYGLAACPGDASEPGALLALAAARLRDAESTRVSPEVHALEPPKV
ncbi:MAG: hypothetical protein ACLPVY_21020 [Acidimicrobiia bacterium]